MNKRIFTFGEIMLRISPQNMGEKITQTNLFKIEPGGSESNVAVCLAQLRHDVVFLSALAGNPIKSLVLKYLKRYGVDTSYIVTKGNRIGIYWTEHGIGLRAASVIYDRENSAFSQLDINDFDWRTISKEANWFHTSGITPSLSAKSCANIFTILGKLDNKTRISVDLNYRSKLWKWINRHREEKIYSIMKKLCSKAYLITGNETDFEDALGYVSSRTQDIESYKKLAESLFSKMQNLHFIGISLRRSHSASLNGWSGILFVKNKRKIFCFNGPLYQINNIVDRVGAGDSFTAGIIHGILQFGDDFKRTIDFATTIAALNHTVFGDASQFDQEDVEAVLASKGEGRIIR